MSGFVALVSTDGAPVDRRVVQRLANALQFRGPDGQESWIGDQAALVHAMFRTKDDARPERQPCSLDGEVWITGDIRVDGRAELIHALTQAGQGASRLSTDPELILHAHRAWGPSMMDRLIGDFSFAIWDQRERRLFCARDQLGIKPLYYAEANGQLLVSNTLSCLCTHGALGDELNEAAIGDFLLFGYNCDPDTTTYARIKRLPGGRTLAWSPGAGLRSRQYWELPRYEELRPSRGEEYLERFKELLQAAVTDRLRTDRVAVHMSGGIDSSMIAAHAKRALERQDKPFALTAHTIVYDRLIPDQERHYSGLVGEALDIPVHHLAADDFGVLEKSESRNASSAEPLDNLWRSRLLNEFAQQVASKSRVVLTGWDGDALLGSSWSAHLSALLGSGRFRQLATDVIRFTGAKQDLLAAIGRRFPRVRREREVAASAYPIWLDADFEQKVQLRERWAELHAVAGNHGGARSSAHFDLGQRNWLRLLESHDAGVTGVATDCRHPLLDLRLVDFLLSLPAIPWCVDKYIFRAAVRPLLPQAIVQRPKAPLAGDPYAGPAAVYLTRFNPQSEPNGSLSRYVDGKSLRAVIDLDGAQQYWMNLRPAVLQRWLRDRPRSDE